MKPVISLMAAIRLATKDIREVRASKMVRAASESSKDREERASISLDSEGSAEVEVARLAEKMMRTVSCRTLSVATVTRLTTHIDEEAA